MKRKKKLFESFNLNFFKKRRLETVLFVKNQEYDSKKF